MGTLDDHSFISTTSMQRNGPAIDHMCIYYLGCIGPYYQKPQYMCTETTLDSNPSSQL